MTLIDRAIDPAWARAARSNPRLAPVVDALPPVASWDSLSDSKAWFSSFHFNGNGAFELPFRPQDYVYSPIVQVPTNPDAFGFYRRGVKKYRTMIKKGMTLPPITFVWITRRDGQGLWALEDGGHRSEAAAQEGLATQPAVLAYPVSLLCRSQTPIGLPRA